MADIFPEDDILQLVRARRGKFVVNRNDQYIGRSIRELGEHHERIVTTLLQLIRPGDVVVDVGANIGTLTVPFAQAVGPTGRVVAFEPQQFVFQTLCANLVLNGLLNVDAYPEAVGERDGRLQLGHVNYHRKQTNFGGLSIDDYQVSSNGIRTSMVRLDDAIDYDRIRLIKIDVEGHERDVLRGGRDLIGRTRPILYVENDRIERSEELIRLIWDLGYRAYWHFSRFYNPENFFVNTEKIFEHVISVNMLCVPEGTDLTMTGFREIEDATDHPSKWQIPE